MLHNLKIQVILPLLTACKFKIGKLHATCYADTISSPATELKQKYQCHTKILSMQHVPFCVNLYAYVPQFLAQNNFMYYYILLFSAVTKFWWLFSCLFATRIFSCMSACLLYNNLLGIDRNMCCGTHVRNLSQVQVNQFSLCFLILRACYFPHRYPSRDYGEQFSILTDSWRPQQCNLTWQGIYPVSSHYLQQQQCVHTFCFWVGGGGGAGFLKLLWHTSSLYYFP